MLARRYSRCALVLALTLCALPAAAGSLEKAKRMYDRLAGVPPTAAELSQMQSDIDGGDALAAADVAMQNPAFYNATLKNWAAPWTNRDDDKFVALNDYIATVIGIVRDGVDYRELLYGNIIYTGANGVVSAAYSNANNTHYEQLEAANVNLGDPAVLVQHTQSSVTGLPADATAGIMTTRAAARAFFIDGTNRAMFRFTLKNHLCHDMEQVQDTTRPSDRIRKDVTRSPGGDSRIFMNTCVGCHSGMDPMVQAFAYYNFAYSGDPDAGQIEYTPGAVQHKYHINEGNFPDGYDTQDDHWDNYWRSGPNTAIFGWSSTHTQATAAAHLVDGIYGDAGAKSMGEELANSQAFAVCSVKKVFKVVCLHDPAAGDQSAFDNMLGNFNSSHNLKNTFAEAAVYCAGN